LRNFGSLHFPTIRQKTLVALSASVSRRICMSKRLTNFLLAVFVLTGVANTTARAGAQQPQPAQTKPYLVEWVYRVKYGYQDEWWKIFQKYQITTLDKEKDLGYVTSYQVVRPGLHTSEDSRWDYRIVIAYKDESSAGHGGEVEKSLFPDADKRKQEENRRWELTTNHWDLPIKEVDPHTTE
jgi:hypothetical protein